VKEKEGLNKNNEDERVMRKLLAVLLAIAFVVAYTVPAIADGGSFYGHARMSTFMDSKSKEKSGTGFDDDDLNWVIQLNDRAGVTAKTGAVGGRFEPGRDYTPVTTLYSNQVWEDDLGLLGWGMPYAGRQDQVALQMGGLQVALLRPSTPEVAAFYIDKTTDIDTVIPKIEVSYDLTAGPVGVGVFGGMNTYDEVDATDQDTIIDSNVMGILANVAFGRYLCKAGTYFGTNLDTYGFTDGGKPTYTTKLNDSHDMGYFLVAGFKASDILSIKAGYGYSEREVDVVGSKTDDSAAYYVQAKIDFAKNVCVVPEIGKFDYKNNAAGVDEGDLTYFSAKWEIRF
jgi:hypothetical protein